MLQYSKILILLWKDVLGHRRTAVTVISVPFFALLVIIIFAFAFNNEELPAGTRQTPAAIIWIAFTFTSILGLSQTFVAEKENGCLKGLLLCPIERHIIYLGKLLSNLALMALSVIIIAPVFFILFGISCRVADFALITFLATLGLSTVGTLLSAISSASRFREFLFPVLFFPLAVPLIIAAVGATSIVFQGRPLIEALPWINILAAFDVLFLVLSLLLFETTMEGP